MPPVTCSSPPAMSSSTPACSARAIAIELATPRQEPQKAIGAAIALLSQGDLPADGEAQLNQATASSLAALRDVSQHTKLLLSVKNNPDLLSSYERHAIAHLRAQPHVAI